LSPPSSPAQPDSGFDNVGRLQEVQHADRLPRSIGDTAVIGEHRNAEVLGSAPHAFLAKMPSGAVAARR
jgi:hypothetical protein